MNGLTQTQAVKKRMKMNGIFKYETKQVRTKIIDDIAWFCLKDVCEFQRQGMLQILKIGQKVTSSI